MISAQVLYCNGVEKVSVRGEGHSIKINSSNTFENFWKFIKILHKNLINSPKFCINKINENLVKFNKNLKKFKEHVEHVVANT